MCNRTKYSATQGHASVVGDMLVSRKVHGFRRESRWYRGYVVYSSLTDLSVKDFLLFEVLK